MLADSPTVDGRRRRSEDSRARIVTAMLDLVHQTGGLPSAEQVAARAGVGLRTVFRHFTDMDSLFAEMSRAIEREVMIIIDRPLAASDWRGKVLELIRRRAELFERIAIHKRAADAHRHSSRFLATDHARLVSLQRAFLRAVLPPEEAQDSVRLEALDLLLSFETWMRLRHDQGLSPRRARTVLEATVKKLID